MPFADRADHRPADSPGPEAQGPEPKAQSAGVRLAWFTPLPPTRSGIAAYSAEVLPHIARMYEVDTFIDPHAGEPAVDLGLSVFPSHEFGWRQRARPYDLVVYQLGNAPWHRYMWPYFVRYPGLVVLHDAQLHHSRAATLLATGRQADYRTEFAFCHPDANPAIAEVVIAGLGGSLFFLWPLMRVPIEASRLVAVHSPWLASDLAATHPDQEFHVIRMGVSDPLTPDAGRGTPDAGRDRIRARYRIGSDEVVFAAYGLLTPEKRLSELLKGLRALLPYAPRARLLLVGGPVDYYDVGADAQAMGVADRVTVAGYVPDEELGDYLAAADVCMCLRWPTSRETSASWMRCVAAGKPTVITDLAHTTSVPALDPRAWNALPARLRSPDEQDAAAVGETRARPEQPGSYDAPVCVAIDILDEQHSLNLAMRRLACDETLRRDLGARAREYWRRYHTPERMAEDYRQAIQRALGRPAPSRDGLPAHLLDDGIGLTQKILGEFGLSLDALDWNPPSLA